MIVQGRLFEKPDQCDPNRYCGDWVQVIKVLKGSPADYYLIDSDTIMLVCSREYVKPGKVGRFHLKSNGGGTYLLIDDIR